jgi:hypothetical protein
MGTPYWPPRIERKREIESVLTPERWDASGSSAASAKRWFTRSMTWKLAL